MMILVCCPGFALSFSEIDFEKLVLQHPTMNSYDSESGYFINSPYEHYDVDKLKKEVEELTSKLEALNKKETKLASQTLETDEVDEETFWNNVSKDSKQKNELENKIWEKISIINSGGEPGYDGLFTIVSKMTKDVICPLYKSNSLTINKLPKFYFSDDINKQELNKLFNYNDSDSLKEYIKRAETFGSIFPNSDKNILYNKKEVDIENVATIDLSLALMLHPKMALFALNNLGFERYELGLSEKEIEDYNDSLKNSHKRNPELDSYKNELNKLYSKKVELYSHLDNTTSFEEISDFNKEFPQREKELQTKIIDAEYLDSYPNLREPQDNIKIIEDIYNDIDIAIKEVLKEKNIELVLNSALPIKPGYSLKYPVSWIKGLGHAGINYIVFYSFYNDNHLTGPYSQQINDCFHRRRFALIDYSLNNPKYILPLYPYPTVVSGGTNILADVTIKIYKKYNVDSSAYPVFDSIIAKIEAYQYGKDY